MSINAEQLQALLADHQPFHSDFQMDYLITARAGGTPYGCYKQALRELNKRYRGLKQLYAERELVQIDLEELEDRLDGLKYHTGLDFEKRRRAVQITQKKMALEEIERTIQDTEREFRRFYSQAAALKEQIGELTSERRAQLDVDMWRHRIKCMAAVDYLTAGRLGVNTVEFVASLPQDLRLPLLTEIANPKAIVEWFDEREIEAPQLTQELQGEIKSLLQ